MSIVWDGRGFTYNQGFATTFINILSLGGCLMIVVAVIIRFGCHIFQRKNQLNVSQRNIQQPYTQAGGAPQIQIMSQTDLQDVRKSHFKCFCFFLIDFLFFTGISLVSLIFPLLSAFEFINIVSAIFINIFVYLFATAYLLLVNPIKGSSKLTIKLQFKTYLQTYKLQLICWTVILLFFAIFLPFLFDKACLCYHNDEYGVQIGETIFSSKITRRHIFIIIIIFSQWLPDQVCPDLSICHVYATLPSETSTSVFINAHTGVGIKEIHLIVTNQLDSRIFKCEYIKFPTEIETRGQRNVFTCLLTNLEPYSLYYFSLLHNLEKPPIFNSTYRTLPSIESFNLIPLSILFGGDFGNEPNGRSLVNSIAQFSPDLIIIGGDVSYDNGYKHCYYSWDTMLSKFEAQFQILGRIVPFLFCVGNHDVGFHSMIGVNITINEEDGPLYFTYFPQMFGNEQNKSGVPAVEKRISYNKHIIGQFIFLGLDTGYLQPQDGEQLEWLKNELSINSEKYYPIPFYHNPMFPTCFSNSSTKYNWRQLVQARDLWMPLFDQYNVIASLENHVHLLKRTYPIKNGKPTQSGEGTVYFGDGSMGVLSGGCITDQQTDQSLFKGMFDLYQVTDNTHIWKLDAYPNNTVQFIAYNENLDIIDGSYYQVGLQVKK